MTSRQISHMGGKTGGLWEVEFTSSKFLGLIMTQVEARFHNEV